MNKKTALCLVCLALFLAFADAQTISPNLSNSKASGQTILFTDEFENLEKWTNTSDWSADGGLLHHSSTPNVAATSTIAACVANCDFSAGTTIWRFALKTSGFTPTTANYFQFFLLTEKADLTNSQNSGYYVSTTTSNPKVLTLNKLEAGGKKSTLLKTDYVWTQDALICVEVIRTATGLWSISYGNSFNNLTTFASSATDVTYSSSDSVGLLFTFTKGNVGKLWADSISVVHQPDPISVADFSFNGTDKITVSFSAEVDSASACNTNNYMLQAGEVISVGYNSSQPKQVVLTVDELQVGSNNLTVSGVADVNGVQMAKNQQFDFDYWIAAQPNDVVINEIFFDPTPVVALPEYDFFEIYNNRNYAISLNGWKVDVAGTQKELSDVAIDANGFVIVTSSSALTQYSKYGTAVVGISTTSLTNTGRAIKLLSANGIVIDSVSYTQNMITDADKQAGGWSLERIDATNFCSQRGNWAASEDETGGTPGRENSVKAENKDLLAPFVTVASFASRQSIKIQFSEPIVSSNLFSSFEIEGLQTVEATDEQTVMLSFENKLADGAYLLKINSISDECGNEMSDTTINLSISTPKVNAVVISEIMADPSPVVGLPEYEYIELYNRTSTNINLEGWTIAVNSTAKKLTQCNIASGGYLILCVPAALAEFEKCGSALAVPSLPAIANSGATITLTDSTGLVIDAITFDAKWITDKEKADGGWSLERIDATNFCSQRGNWAASEDETGGTPGRENSVKAENKDLLAPFVTEALFASRQSIKIQFSEPIVSSNLFSSFEIEGLQTVEAADEQTVVLSFENKLADGAYLLKINSISDECGNEMSDTTINLSISTPKVNDVVISEIMADPSPVVGLPEYEYIELYNRTSTNINLEGWTIAVNSTAKKLTQCNIVSGGYLILCVPAALAELEKCGSALAVPSLPAIANSGATITLTDSTGLVIDAITFDAKWITDKEKADGGWSLERIDVNNLCGGANNWLASVDIAGGTPGKQNSVKANNIDNKPIAVVSTHIANEKQIVLGLSELSDSQTTMLVSNYQLDGKSPQKVLLDGLQLTLTFAQPFAIDTQLHLAVKNISDQCGNAINDTALTLVYHKVGLYDLVITEIMATPEPMVGLPACEYVELYNNSNFDIETDSISIKIGKTTAKLEHNVIAAHQYALVAKTSAVDSLSQFGTVVGSQKMPSIPATGSISVFWQGDLVCYTNYSSSWYADELKKEGGYSLERISIASSNESQNNWTETVDVKGGTPCQPNSVALDVADTIAPIALYAVPLSEKQIRIVFSKMVKIDDVSFVEIQPSIGYLSSFAVAADNYNAIDATLPVSINPNIDYSITYSKMIVDVSGNAIVTDTLHLFMPEVAEVGDVVINEVLFNPNAGGCDFVELYNRSDHAVNLATFCLATRSGGAIKTPKHIEQPGYVLPSGGYVVLSTSSQMVMSQYETTNSLAFFNLASLPTYANDHGVVVLVDTAGVVYDEFEYDKKMHFALLSSVTGVSLERIDPNKPADNAANWHSAAEYTGGATPGYQNSCFAQIASSSSTISIENEVFSPDNDGFDDQLNIGYQFEEAGNVASVIIFNAKGVRVRKLVSNEQLGTSGFWSWDGLDDNGNRVPIGVYVVYCELFNVEGEAKQIKKPCVVSARMD